jgi:hypothetical protein
MANPTTNYGFVMPTPTDLVTDLPADFEVFGQDVDTQMLTNANAATQKATLTTTGDIYYASSASTPARLGIGSTGNVLTVTGGVPVWAAGPAGYTTVQLFTSSTTWTVPAGITRCAVYAVGGGGGGGSGQARVSSGLSLGGNGGNGGFLGQEPYYTVTPAASITVTIGAGGAGAAASATITTNLAGSIGTIGNDSVFGNLIAGGGAGGAGGKTTSPNDSNSLRVGSTFIAGRYAAAATSISANAVAGSTGVSSVLTQAGSTGSAGTTPTVGTTLNAGGTSINAGFGGSGGQGATNSDPSTFIYAGGSGTEGGGGGGGGAISASNITTTAGAGGAGATNRGGGGGGGGGAEKIGTSTTTVTSGAGGAGGSGFVAIFY